MRALVSIAGHDLPDPSAYSGTTATLVDSGRNVKGVVIAAVIRDDVGKVEMSYKFLPTAKWAEILSLFSIKRGGSFTNKVTFFCQDTGGWETREMYVNDRSAGMFKRDAAGSVVGWTDCKINLIEV